MRAADYEHMDLLLPETKEMLDSNGDDRIEYLRTDKWIPYPRANQILKKIEELLKEPTKTRMSNLLIVGESNNGKTSLVKKFWRSHPPSDGLYEDAYPVMYVQAPPVPDERRFYDAILTVLLVPFRHRDAPSQKIADISYYFNKIGTRMLIVDEIHNILSGSVPKQRAFMNALKNLGNQLAIPIVLVGTKDALMATNTDMQISSRFKPEHLPVWRLDREFVQLLASIETTLPLRKPSDLATKELAQEIYRLSEGYIGEIVAVIGEAAVVAIQSGSERITTKEIKESGFIPPSKRRVITELESG
ncbi:MAG: hypothetical protein CXR31_11665 [Geobacter sp.]|nr:MAG: hypothetical protein CXR31_11665 [Geobacter sp.]